MKIGLCTSPDRAAAAKASGFDYIEVAVSAVAAMSESEYEKALASLSQAGIRAEAANVLLPGGYRVTGPDADLKAVEAHVSRVFPMLKKMGVGPVVFGSGGARRYPDDFPKDKAFIQLIEAARVVADVAAQNGLVIVAEPLNTGETNIINTVAEGGEWVEAVAHPAFRLLADYFHVGKSGEGFDGIVKYGSLIKHTHIAHPVTRKTMAENDGGGYEGFIEALRSSGYDARVSFEGSIGDYDAEIPGTVALLRRLIG